MHTPTRPQRFLDPFQPFSAAASGTPWAPVTLAIACVALLAGCKAQSSPDYARPLPSGARALRKVPPDQWPSFALAHQDADGTLDEALRRSLGWFAKASTAQFYPIEGITHEQARLSVLALLDAVSQSRSSEQFESIVRSEFDLYTSVGWDGRGTVLFTGYYSPIFNASRTPTSEYRYPLYARPNDLESDPITGDVLGRRVGAVLIRYPARAQIETSPQALGLEGRELVYMRDRFESYVVQVNGSARLQMTDGTTMHIGYAGSNGRDYTSIGQLLVRDGVIDKSELSLPALRAYFRKHPERLDRYIQKNERYVFFQPFAGDQWPAGSLGFKVTPWRSLATDKSIFPRGGAVFVVTQVPTATGAAGGTAVATRPFAQLMVDQDTGGAIRAAGRADMYMGIGPQAETVAGRQAAEGRLYYLFLKPQHLNAWRQRDDTAPIPVADAPT